MRTFTSSRSNSDNRGLMKFLNKQWWHKKMTATIIDRLIHSTINRY